MSAMTNIHCYNVKLLVAWYLALKLLGYAVVVYAYHTIAVDMLIDRRTTHLLNL